MHTTDELNTALAGRYTIERHIGEGGMAMVYLARDAKHNRKVALKVLKADLGAVVGVERFLSEIQVTANLQHPNLLPLFDSGAADSLLFYVMPYIEGESLRVRLEREKQLPVEEAVRIATAIGSALDYAHRHGVIHRDLKPENILLHEDQPLVADFGIALAVSKAGGNRITQTGLSLGTPQYMSPEQATGDRVIDGRTDIYSLGALTYEMLTGEPPHTGPTSQAVIARVLTDQPRSIRLSRPTVPEHVEAAIEQALEKLPADRWATAKEFSEAMTGLRIVTRATAGAMTAASLRRRPAPREIAGWIVAAAALAGLAYVSLADDRPAIVPTPVQFELLLPDSLDTRPRGPQSSIALSPDGSTIVFQATPRGSSVPALYVRGLDDRSIQKIRGTDSARAPALSPDGNDVLFVPLQSTTTGTGGSGSASGWMAKQVSIRGGTARTVVDSASGNGQVSWGDGGRLVLGLRDRLWTAPATGGPRTLLAAPDSTRRHLRYGFPHVLPGGNAALITIWKGDLVLDSTVLGVVTIPQGKVSELTVRGTYPRYSETGHIVYGTADSRLSAVPFDARSHRVTGPAFLVAEDARVGSGGAAAFDVARNGTLAYLSGNELVPGGLTMVAVSRTGTVRSLGAPAGFYGYPRVSPDGRQIAVTRPIAPGPVFPKPDIWRFDTTSKAMVRVTTDSSSVRSSWTPDGERLVYAKFPIDTVILSRPLYAAGQPVPLLHSPNQLADITLGKRRGYAAIRIDGGTNRSEDIWLVHMDSLASPRPFLAEPYREMSPAISADGALLAYVTNRTGANEVYVRPILGGGSEVKVSVSGGYEPVWSRTGRELFYRGTDYYVAAQVSDGARPSVVRRDPLFRDVYPRMGVAVAQWDVFPGGQEFVMLQPTTSATGTNMPLIVVMNWHLRGRAVQPPR